MTLEPLTSTAIVLPVCIFAVAVLYASVGHGGASGYLALLSFLSVPHEQMATTALILNLLVSSIALYSFLKAGYLSRDLTLPFIVSSVPCAFVGGVIHISPRIYGLVLGLVLIVAAFRLALALPKTHNISVYRMPKLVASLPIGAGIGFVSGLVGVGGGIFLSPIMLLCRWADAKHTAATSACFIVVNSIAGLGGRGISGGLDVGVLWPLMGAAAVGGLIGSRLGANKFSGLMLRRILAFVLVCAAGKLIYLAL